MGKAFIVFIAVISASAFICCSTDKKNLADTNKIILDSLVRECGKRLNSPELKNFSLLLKREALERSSNRHAGLACGYMVMYYTKYSNIKNIDDSIRFYGEEAKKYFRMADYPEGYLRAEADLLRWEIQHVNLEHTFIRIFNLIKEAEEKGNQKVILEGYSTLGWAYWASNSPKEAHDAFLNELAAIRKMNLKAGTKLANLYISAFLELGNVALLMNETDLALSYSDSAIVYLGKLPEKFDKSGLQLASDIFRVNTLVQKNELNNAKPYLDELLQFCNNKKDMHTEFYFDVQTALSGYYFKNKEYDNALQSINQVIEYYTTNSNYTLNLNDAKDSKADILAAHGSFEEAFALKNEVVAYKDSVAKKNASRQLSEMQTLYQVNELEKQASINTIRSQRMRQIITILIIVCSLLMILTIIIRRNYNKLRKKNKKIFDQYKDLHKYRKEISELNASIIQSDPLAHGKEPSLYERLEELILNTQCYTEPDITRESLSSKLYTNREYLTRAIQENANMTFTEYINHYRLEYARQLLSDIQNLSIESVYIAAGFNNKSTFYRLFKQKYDMTPKEFQKIAMSSSHNNY